MRLRARLRSGLSTHTRLTHASPRAQDGSTALIAAVYAEQEAAAALLLSAGADVAARTDDGDTALMFAALRGSAPLMELLLDAGADANARNKARARCRPLFGAFLS